MAKAPFRKGSLRLDAETATRSYEITLDMAFPEDERPRSLRPFCTGILIVMEYDEAMCPYATLDLVVDRETLVRLRMRWREARFVLSVGHRRKIGQHDDDVVDSTTPWFPKTSFATLDMDEGTPPREEIVDGTIPSYQVTLFLFAEPHLAAGKKTVNKVFCNATAEEALAWLAGDMAAGIPLIGKPDSRGKHENIVIPPCTFAQSVDWLQDWYGLWEAGPRFFEDFTHCVVLGKNQFVPKEDDWPLTVFAVFDPSQADPRVTEPDASDPEKRVYEIRVPESDLSIVQEDGFSRETDGQIIRAAGASAETVNTTLQGTGGGGLSAPRQKPKDRPLWSRTSEGLSFASKLRRVNETAEAVTLSATKHHISAFAMERRARIEFVGDEARQWIGDFRFAAVRHAFVKAPLDADFDLTSEADLVRV